MWVDDAKTEIAEGDLRPAGARDCGPGGGLSPARY